jgi:hypothetical protein
MIAMTTRRADRMGEPVAFRTRATGVSLHRERWV